MLAIWQRDNSGSGYDLYARPLDSSGVPTAAPFIIQETAGNQQNVAIAYGANQRTQLAWQDDRKGGWDLFTAVLDRSYQVTHIEYDYDPLYRLVKAEYSGDVSAGYTYIYDAVGNMTAYEETIGTATTSVNRTFNAANQLLVSVDSQAGTSTFTYDNNGNLKRINLPGFAEEKLLYAYNQRNLLILVSRQLGQTAPQEEAAFVYDGDGNRLQQIDYTGSQPATTSYTNDIIGLSQVLVSTDGTTTTYNLFGLDLISQNDGSQTRYLLTDGLGSTRTEMVGSTLETTTTYEPYGRLLTQTGTTGTVYGFTGEEYDDATGLVYLRARYYNPALQMFMSADPWAGSIFNPQTLHGYSYVKGNVVNLLDPTGECYGPFRFLRRVESTNCNNLDMAVSIVTHPNASIGQRAGAAVYATAMVGSHVMLATGSAMLAPTAISAAGGAIGSTAGTGMTYAMAYGAAHPTAAAATTLAPAAWSVLDDAVVAYGAASRDPYAQQQALLAYQLGQADGGFGLFDGVGGLRAAANIGRRGITNILDNCAARFRLRGGGGGVTGSFGTEVPGLLNRLDDNEVIYQFSRPPRNDQYQGFPKELRPGERGMSCQVASLCNHNPTQGFLQQFDRDPGPGDWVRETTVGGVRNWGGRVEYDGFSGNPWGNPPGHATIYSTGGSWGKPFARIWNNERPLIPQ